MEGRTASMPLTGICRPRLCFSAGKNYFLQGTVHRQPGRLPRLFQRVRPGTFVLWEVVMTGVVLGSDIVVTFVVVTGVFPVGGSFSNRLNEVDPVTSMMVPDTLTRYSSGLNADVSTSKDQRFIPPLPGCTVTVPDEPGKFSALRFLRWFEG